MRKAALVLALCLLATPLAAADDLPPGGTFSATATMTTSQGTRSLPVTVVVSHSIGLDQTAPLKRMLAEGGQRALAAYIRGGREGMIRLGALETPIELIVAEKTDDGARYFVVTSRAMSFEEVQLGSPSLDFPFAILAFDVPDFGTGEGRVLPKAALAVDEDGHVVAAQYDAEPGKLTDVKAIDPL